MNENNTAFTTSEITITEERYRELIRAKMKLELIEAHIRFCEESKRACLDDSVIRMIVSLRPEAHA